MKQKIKNILIKNATYLWLFILGLVSAWAWQLLPWKVIKLFDTSRKFQLGLIYLLVLFTLDIITPENRSIIQIFVQTTMTFFLYLAFTKQSLNFFIASCVLLCIFIVLETVVEPRVRHKDKNMLITLHLVYLLF